MNNYAGYNYRPTLGDILELIKANITNHNDRRCVVGKVVWK